MPLRVAWKPFKWQWPWPISKVKMGKKLRKYVNVIYITFDLIFSRSTWHALGSCIEWLVFCILLLDNSTNWAIGVPVVHTPISHPLCLWSQFSSAWPSICSPISHPLCMWSWSTSAWPSVHAPISHPLCLSCLLTSARSSVHAPISHPLCMWSQSGSAWPSVYSLRSPSHLPVILVCLNLFNHISSPSAHGVGLLQSVHPYHIPSACDLSLAFSLAFSQFTHISSPQPVISVCISLAFNPFTHISSPLLCDHSVSAWPQVHAPISHQ